MFQSKKIKELESKIDELRNRINYLEFVDKVKPKYEIGKLTSDIRVLDVFPNKESIFFYKNSKPYENYTGYKYYILNKKTNELQYIFEEKLTELIQNN